MVVASYVDDSVGCDRRGVHMAPGRVVPHLCPGCRVEGINIVVVASYVDDSVGDCRGGVHCTSGCATPNQLTIRRAGLCYQDVVGSIFYVVAKLHGAARSLDVSIPHSSKENGTKEHNYDKGENPIHAHASIHFVSFSCLFAENDSKA